MHIITLKTFIIGDILWKINGLIKGRKLRIEIIGISEEYEKKRYSPSFTIFNKRYFEVTLPHIRGSLSTLWYRFKVKALIRIAERWAKKESLTWEEINILRKLNSN